MPLLVSGTNPRKAREQALEALDQVGLANRSDHRPAELSGGERQRVTIARALVNNPVVVWADEPTGDLDSETADQVMDLLVKLNEQRDLTFLLVTHARRVAARCSRIVRMRDGQIEGEQTPEEVLAQLSQIPSMMDEIQE
jgi:putative ABC transport system ATP-binding protein